MKCLTHLQEAYGARIITTFQARQRTMYGKWFCHLFGWYHSKINILHHFFISIVNILDFTLKTNVKCFCLKANFIHTGKYITLITFLTKKLEFNTGLFYLLMNKVIWIKCVFDIWIEQLAYPLHRQNFKCQKPANSG